MNRGRVGPRSARPNKKMIALSAITLLALIGASCVSLAEQPAAAHHKAKARKAGNGYAAATSRYPSSHHHHKKAKRETPVKPHRAKKHHRSPTRPSTVGTPPENRRHGGVPATVTRVVDGDTIYVTLHGHETDIRLIGIDTPETVDPNSPVMCYGPQASAFTHSRLAGAAVPGLGATRRNRCA